MLVSNIKTPINAISLNFCLLLFCLGLVIPTAYAATPNYSPEIVFGERGDSGSDQVDIIYAKKYEFPFVVQASDEASFQVTLFAKGQFSTIHLFAETAGQVQDIQTGKFKDENDCIVLGIDQSPADPNVEIICLDDYGSPDTYAKLTTGHTRLIVEDIDRDGLDDLVTQEGYQPSNILFYRNEGNGTFSEALIAETENRELYGAGEFLTATSGAILTGDISGKNLVLLALDGTKVTLDPELEAIENISGKTDITSARLNLSSTAALESLLLYEVGLNESEIALVTLDSQNQAQVELLSLPTGSALDCFSSALVDLNDDDYSDLVCLGHSNDNVVNYRLNGPSGFEANYHPFYTEATLGYDLKFDKNRHMFISDAWTKTIFARGKLD